MGTIVTRDDQNIGSWLRRHASLDGEKPAIIFGDDAPLTYRHLSDWVDKTATALRDKYGVTKGERVGYLGLNDPGVMTLLFACARIGAILVPVNWRLAPAEVAYIFNDCKPRVVFYSADFVETAENTADELSVHAEPVEKIHGWRLADRDRESELASCDAFAETGQIDDLLLIVYTSGTTGRPKGAVLSQRAVFVNALNSVDMHELRRTDIVLILLPLFHVGGLNILLTPALYIGATVHLHARFDPVATYAAIADVKPDLMVLVPAMMVAMMELPQWKEADFSCLRCLTTGSSLIPVDLIAAYEARGISVIQVYGSSETCPIAAYQRPGEGASHPTSTGKVALHSRLRLVDQSGQVVATPETDGEIEVFGDHVMDHYWNNEEASADSFNDGWFRTGDIARLDEEGYLYFQERRTNLIISGGENIYPAEIERIIQAIDNIIEVCVVGVPDEKWGAVPIAAVAVEKEGPDEAQIRSVLETKLARYKLPKKIIFFEVLPRNAMGKIVAGKVKEMLVAQ